MKIAKSVFTTFLEVFALVVLANALYMIVMDYVLFNKKALDTNLEFLFFLAPVLVALVLTIAITFLFDRIHSFYSNLILVLINIYGFISSLMPISRYCNPDKNFDLFYGLIVALILIFVAFTLLKNILPKMQRKNILVVALVTIIFFFEAHFLLIGYRIFYPGFW